MSYHIDHYKQDGSRRDSARAVVRFDVPSDADEISIDVQGDVRITLGLTRSTGSATLPPITGTGKDASDRTTEVTMRQETASERGPTTPDWDNIIESWASEARMQQRSDRYIAQVKGQISRLLEYNEIDLIPDIRRQSVMDYLQMLHDEGVRGRPASPKTLNNNLAAFRSFFEWMRSSETAPASWENPCEKIRSLKAISKEGRAFTQDETMAIYRAAVEDENSEKPRSPKIRSPLYRILYLTGIRIGIAKHIRIRNFEFDRDPCVLYIKGESNNRKEMRERELVIPEADREWFMRMFHGKDRNDLAFCNPTLKTLKLDARLAKVDLVDSRGRGVGYHCFRRFVGTELDRMNVSPNLIQKQLGHRSIKTTLTSYVKRDLTEASGAIADLSEKMSSKNPDRPVDTHGRGDQSVQVDPNQTQRTETSVVREGQGSKNRDRHPSEPPIASGAQPRPHDGQRRDSEMGYTGLEPVTPSVSYWCASQLRQ